ncbi:MAG: hypothetical protein LBH14_00130 [Desulfobulbaceae bacterium]|jgi:hypothetical protein|nr:hypothetical protein [Desulfobulbaceae bacterium]
MILRYRRLPENERNAENFKCQAIAAWPSVYTFSYSPCVSAYRELFGKEFDKEKIPILPGIHNPIAADAPPPPPESPNNAAKPNPN